MKYLIVLFLVVMTSCNSNSNSNQSFVYLPFWRIDTDSLFYEQCRRMPKKSEDVVYKQCFLIYKTDKSFSCQGKIFFLEVDTVAYCPNIDIYFKSCLPTVNSQVEDIFWVKALVDAGGKINQWGFYSDRNKTDERYLIPLNKAILTMPRWVPAKKQGKNVHSLVTFSVRF
jgi:hypothetical protein